MTEPLVSVILIGFQDEARIGRALASVRNQTLHSIEIIVVDDASTDGTETIIRDAMAGDPRIRYERLATNSGGCSAPRNAGLGLARAPWVMFCDSDDEMEMHACANLLDAAERLDADMVCGTAARIDVRSGAVSRWRPDLHAEERLFTDFDEGLLYDTIVPNKIFRRSMLEESGIRFPDDVLFEDQPFTLACLLAARRVAVITPIVYRWFVERGEDEGSITQGRSQVRNVRDRIAVNRLMDAMLVGRPAWQAAKAVKFLRHECYLYLSTILEASDESALDVMAELDGYVREVPVEAFWQVRSPLRVALFHLLRGDLAGIRRAMRFERWGAVVDARLVVESDAVLFDRDPSVEILGRPSRAWLDVSDLRLTDMPFEMRRYLHRLEVFERDGDTVTALVRTTDHIGDLGAVDAELAWCDGRGDPILVLPLEVAGVDGHDRLWRGVGRLSLAPHRVVRRSDAGTVRILMRRDAAVNSTPVRTTCSPRTFTLGALTRTPGATEVREEGRERAELAWRAGGESRGLLPLVRRVLGGRWVPPEQAIPPVRDRVFVAYLPLLPATPSATLPDPWRVVPFDLDSWNAHFGSRAVLLVGGEGMPPVPFRMRGWAWDARRLRIDRVIEASAVVITDDPLILTAHPSAIAFRPDRGAARYILPPLASALETQAALFEAIEARLAVRT